jgi:hypothetical protein
MASAATLMSSRRVFSPVDRLWCTGRAALDRADLARQSLFILSSLWFSAPTAPGQSLRFSLLGSFHAIVVHVGEKPVGRLEQFVELGG